MEFNGLFCVCVRVSIEEFWRFLQDFSRIIKISLDSKGLIGLLEVIEIWSGID